jgi:hypothetical protein
MLMSDPESISNNPNDASRSGVGMSSRRTQYDQQHPFTLRSLIHSRDAGIVIGKGVFPLFVC